MPKKFRPKKVDPGQHPEVYYTIDFKSLEDEKLRRREQRAREAWEAEHGVNHKDVEALKNEKQEQEAQVRNEFESLLRAEREKLNKLHAAAQKKAASRRKHVVPRALWRKAVKKIIRKKYTTGHRVLANKRNLKLDEGQTNEPNIQTWEELMETFPGGIRFFFARLFSLYQDKRCRVSESLKESETRGAFMAKVLVSDTIFQLVVIPVLYIQWSNSLVYLLALQYVYWILLATGILYLVNFCFISLSSLSHSHPWDFILYLFKTLIYMAFMVACTALLERGIIFHQIKERQYAETSVIPPLEDVLEMKKILETERPYTYTCATLYYIILMCLTYIALCIAFTCFHKEVDLYNDRVYYVIGLVHLVILPVNSAVCWYLRSSLNGPYEWLLFQLVLVPFLSTVWIWFKLTNFRDILHGERYPIEPSSWFIVAVAYNY